MDTMHTSYIMFVVLSMDTVDLVCIHLLTILVVPLCILARVVVPNRHYLYYE